MQEEFIKVQSRLRLVKQHCEGQHHFNLFLMFVQGFVELVKWVVMRSENTRVFQSPISPEKPFPIKTPCLLLRSKKSCPIIYHFFVPWIKSLSDGHFGRMPYPWALDDRLVNECVICKSGGNREMLHFSFPFCWCFAVKWNCAKLCRNYRKEITLTALAKIFKKMSFKLTIGSLKQWCWIFKLQLKFKFFKSHAFLI